MLDGIDLLKCQNCDFVYADITDEEIEKANSSYDGVAVLRYEERQTLLDAVWFEAIARRFTRKLGPGRVLDVGCGNGVLLGHLKSYGWDCCGIDPSPWSIKPSEKHGYSLVQGRLEDSNVEEGAFDLVASTSTLEHIPQPVLHVEEALKRIKPGGVGYFAGMPNYGSVSVTLGLSPFYHNVPPRHVNYFTPTTLSRLFRYLEKPPARVLIRTYGIPETHRVYNTIGRAIHRWGRAVRSSRRIRERAASTTQRKTLSKVIAELFVGLYFCAGRVGSIGDKLEVTIET